MPPRIAPNSGRRGRGRASLGVARGGARGGTVRQNTAARARETRQAPLAGEREARVIRRAEIREAQREEVQGEFEPQVDVEGEGNREMPQSEANAPQMLNANDLIQQITMALAGAFRMHNETQLRERRLAYLMNFCEMNPPVFEGETDPLVAEGWLEQVTKILDAMEVVDNATRILLATFQFRGPADWWWETIKNTQDVTEMEWETFKHLFLEKYFPTVFRSQMWFDFINLVQGTMSVTEYEVTFTTLSRFAPEMVSTSELKCDHFLRGLEPSIQEQLSAHIFIDYEKLVHAARVEEQRMEARKIHETSAARGGSYGTPTPYTGKKRTRDDVVASRGGQQFRAPQSTLITPTQSQTPRNQIVCYGCGRTGHIQARCRSTQQATSRVTLGPIICYHCSQPGHIVRQCPQLQGQRGVGTGGLYYTGTSASQVASTQQGFRVPTWSASSVSPSQGSRASSVAPRGRGPASKGYTTG